MPKARKNQICLSETSYYHCYSRCVRRAFLCGNDPLTGKSYDYRKSWVKERLLLLSSIYAIDICAFAVMSNHTHIVVNINQHKASQWSDKRVCELWQKLHYGTLLSRKYVNGDDIEEYLIPTITATAKVYRDRLSSISWFMRDLNEYIARLANAEDECSGRFWEGRFNSQALLDESALLTCMAYVDLNPIRAKIAKSPETSDHTSIQMRINAACKGEQPRELAPFVKEQSTSDKGGLHQYLKLIKSTGHCMMGEQSASIELIQVSHLSSINISEENWLLLTQEFEHLFRGAVGAISSINHYCEHQNMQRRQNSHNSIRLFG